MFLFYWYPTIFHMESILWRLDLCRMSVGLDSSEILLFQLSAITYAVHYAKHLFSCAMLMSEICVALSVTGPINPFTTISIIVVEWHVMHSTS